ncbi:MAG: hypothetical protein IJ072_00745 [Oscillospiraceae bacterium]|nr:hypothetical protein [Oscillospiraceae bacterium]
MAAQSMDDIAELFKNVRFKKKLFGGVSEKDVWRQLEKIQSQYRAAYEYQAAGYEALLREREQMIAELRTRLNGESGR